MPFSLYAVVFLEIFPGGSNVLADLCPQGFGTWESLLFPQEGKEFKAHLFAIEIAGKVQNVGLHRELVSLPEGGANANVCDRGFRAVRQPDLSRCRAPQTRQQDP